MNHLKSCGFKRGAVFLGLIVSTAVVAFPVSFGGCDETDEGSSPEMGPGPRAAFISSVQGDTGPDYEFAKVDGRALAVNRARGLRAEMVDGIIRIESDSDNPDWSMRIRWSGIGRGERIEPIEAPLDNAGIEGNRATYRRRDGSEEWYLNGPLGIEQGFVIDERPGSDTGELVLQVTVAGLHPVLSGNGSEVSLHKTNGEKALRYTDLYALDANGAVLNTFMSVSDGAILLHVEDEHARYPIAVDPLVWCETKKLTASDAEAEDYFGSVAVSGDTAVVGAEGEDTGGSNAGAAYVFYRNEGGTNNWGEVKKLIASDAEVDDYFGSGAVSGDTAIVGAHGEDTGGSDAGAVYVFYRNEGGVDNWGEVKKLTASDAESSDHFGISVAIGGDTIVVGAHGENTGGLYAGAVYIFERDYGGTDNWGEVKKLIASDTEAEDFFGLPVSVSGDTAIVGAHGEDMEGSLAGAAYVFQRNQGGADNWGEVKKLTASDAEADDGFGISVAIGGDTAIVGAVLEDTGGSSAGAAYVFYKDQGGADNWGEVKKLTASDAEAGDSLGPVTISGDTAVVGALWEDTGGSNAGAAYVFQRDQGGADNWGEVKKLTASDAEAGDHFGSVAIGGDTVVVGASWEDNGGSESGAVYVFQLALEIGDNCTAPSDCFSGFCVDGVCCDDACGGDETTDCQACSVAAGASTDGICEDLTMGTTCDDGFFCTATDTCDSSGSCVGTGDPCPGLDGDEDCAESCDETADDCTENDPDGSICDDADSTTIDDQCASGVCDGTASDTDTDTDTDSDTDSDAGTGGGDSSGCGCRAVGTAGSDAGLLDLLMAIISEDNYLNPILGFPTNLT